MEYTNWLIKLKHAFIALGYFKSNKVVRIDRNAFKHFYDDGISPIESALIDLNEGGE